MGLKHFKELVNSVYFGRLVKNTFILSIEQLLWSFPIPIAFALLLNELKHSGIRRVAQTAAYLPHFVSVVVVVGILKDLLASDGGVLTQLLAGFGYGLKIISIFRKRSAHCMWAPACGRNLVGIPSSMWQGNFGIDQEMYESAALDGAGRWKKLIYITLPSIAPTIILLLILNMGNMLNIGYEKVILMYNSATYSTADIFSTYVYRKGLLNAQYSFASAVGLANSLINVIFCWGPISLRKSDGYKYILTERAGAVTGQICTVPGTEGYEQKRKICTFGYSDIDSNNSHHYHHLIPGYLCSEHVLQ